MARPRKGVAFEQRGTIYTGVRLRDGKRKTWPVSQLLPPPTGVPVSLEWARIVSQKLQARYDATGDLPALPSLAKPAAIANENTEHSVAAYVAAWIAKQTYESAGDDARAVQTYALPSRALATPLREAKPKHMVAFIDELRSRASERGGTLAPRTIRNAFDVVRRALDQAVIDELLVTNPCASIRRRLPTIEDKDPAARATWMHTRSDIERMLAPHPAIQSDWRVRWAIAYCTGARHGETRALRWGDWHREVEPLTRLTIARAIKSRSGREGRTKTGAIKHVPVHPVLEAVLLWWWEQGWRETYGREPTLDDLLVPAVRGRKEVRGGPVGQAAVNRAFRRHQQAAGVSRTLHAHTTRHTFISLTQDDGADGAILRWATHAPPSTAFDGYSRTQWGKLCAELSKLRLFVAEGSVTGSVTPPSAEVESPGNQGADQRKHTGIEPESEQDSAGFRSLADTVALDPLRYVTSSVTGYDETVWADYLNFVWHVREGKLRAVPLAES